MLLYSRRFVVGNGKHQPKQKANLGWDNDTAAIHPQECTLICALGSNYGIVCWETAIHVKWWPMGNRSSLNIGINSGALKIASWNLVELSTFLSFFLRIGPRIKAPLNVFLFPVILCCNTIHCSELSRPVERWHMTPPRAHTSPWALLHSMSMYLSSCQSSRSHAIKSIFN